MTSTPAGQGSTDRALVIGATGLVGSAVARRLVDDGWKVTATARSARSTEWAGGALVGARVEILPAVQDNGAVTELLIRSNPRVVISCAGVMSASGANGIRTLVDGNVAAVAVLLDACARAGIDRAIVLGSGFEYAPANGPIAEEGTIGPTTIYGATKVAASDIARHFRDLTEMDVCVVRPFSLYGPREHLHRFVPHVVTSALDDQPIVMSAGTQTRDYLYVEDLAEGLAKAASYDRRLPSVLNFAGPGTHSLIDIATTIIELTGSQAPLRPGSRAANPADRIVFLGDSGLARRILDWHPANDLLSGLARTIDWYGSHRALWQVAV